MLDGKKIIKSGKIVRMVKNMYLHRDANPCLWNTVLGSSPDGDTCFLFQ